MARVVLYQDSIAVYEHPDTESPTLTRLSKGTPFIVLDSVEEAHPSWLAIEFEGSQRGFIKKTAKTTTLEQLQQERQAIRRAGTMGWGWIGIGTLLSLAGAAVSIFTLLESDKEKSGGAIVWYGAIAVGLGMLIRGIEQVSSARFTLRKFDQLYSRIL